MPAPTTAPTNTAKAKLQRLRALARERRVESRGDTKKMEQEDRTVFEAYRNSRDSANESK